MFCIDEYDAIDGFPLIWCFVYIYYVLVLGVFCELIDITSDLPWWFLSISRILTLSHKALWFLTYSIWCSICSHKSPWQMTSLTWSFPIYLKKAISVQKIFTIHLCPKECLSVFSVEFEFALLIVFRYSNILWKWSRHRSMFEGVTSKTWPHKGWHLHHLKTV